MALKALFFDAGNTLVYANLQKTLAPLHARGLQATQAQLYAAERYAKHCLDASRAEHPEDRSIDKRFWDIYYGHLLRLIGVNDDSLCTALSAATRVSGHWDQVRPGTREVLDGLRGRGLRLAVISNSDGGIADVIARVGLGDCFDSYSDSTLVGFEKPDPRIFQSALRSLGADPAESMYVGDVYSLDYLGAKAAGMDAMLMDVSRTYAEMDYPRIESLEELEKRLGM